MAGDNSQAQPRPAAGSRVAYGPLDTLVGVNKDGLVVLRIECVTGMHVYLLDPEQAEALGAFLQRQAATAKTGLTIVGG